MDGADTASAMRLALVRAQLITKEQAEKAPLIPHHLRPLFQEVERLRARLPENDNPPNGDSLRLEVGILMAWGKQKEALEATRSAMIRRLEELGL